MEQTKPEPMRVKVEFACRPYVANHLIVLATILMAEYPDEINMIADSIDITLDYLKECLNDATNEYSEINSAFTEQGITERFLAL